MLNIDFQGVQSVSGALSLTCAYLHFCVLPDEIITNTQPHTIDNVPVSLRSVVVGLSQLPSFIAWACHNCHHLLLDYSQIGIFALLWRFLLYAHQLPVAIAATQVL